MNGSSLEKSRIKVMAAKNARLRRIFQGEVGIHPLEPAIFVFEFLQPLDIRRLQAAVLGFPLVVRRGTDAVAAPDLVDRPASASFRSDTICVSVNFDCA